jgi:hypothetical protein
VSDYQLVIGEAAAQVFVAASRVDQRRLGVILDELKANPFRRGDLQEHDAAGRVCEILINSYAPDFADAGMPLTPDQTNGLIQAMADANYAGKDISTRPPNYNVPDPTTDLSIHDDRIINNATPVLSPPQLQLLTTDQAENEQIAAIMKAYSGGGKPVIFLP